MAAQGLDKIYASRTGVAIPSGRISNFLTVDDVKSYVLTDTDFATQVASVIATNNLEDDVSAASLSLNGSNLEIGVTEDGNTVNGTLALSALATGLTPSLNGTVTPAAHTHVIADITDFVAGVTANETSFAATSPNLSITITNAGTNGHGPTFDIVPDTSATLIAASAPALATLKTAFNYSAAEISYDNTTSGLTASNVKAAIDELSTVTTHTEATDDNTGVDITAGTQIISFNPTVSATTLAGSATAMTSLAGGFSATDSATIVSNLNAAGEAALATALTDDLNGSITPAAHTHVVADVTDFAAGVAANETTFAATSSDSTITITTGGTSGHTPNLVVNYAGAPADSIDGTAINWGSLDATDITDFKTVVGTNLDGSIAQNGTTGQITYTSSSGATTTSEVLGVEATNLATIAANGGILVIEPDTQLP